MAEVKNAFIKSKMNKDLDDRLLPSGEYRDAQNVQISRSEGSDVGALENVLGNTEILFSASNLSFSTLVAAPNIQCIGQFVDENNTTIYSFWTDNFDTLAATRIIYNPAAKNYIMAYNIQSQQFTVLVEGAFLNFSQTNPIIGVNVIEGLLFWTDNRNQPRKININFANGLGSTYTIPTYYVDEDSISVSTYNPYQPIEVLNVSSLGAAQIATATTDGIVDNSKTIILTSVVGALTQGLGVSGAGVKSGTIITKVVSPTSIETNKANIIDTGIPLIFRGLETTMYDVTSLILPNGGTASVNGTPTATTLIPIDGITGEIIPGATVTGAGVLAATTVVSYTAPNVTVNNTLTLADDVVLTFNENPYLETDYGGDPQFLEDKFIRFSYRFKFDDGEYSIFAPFTQSMFIPKQDGYFISDDEKLTYESTIVQFMENKVTKIDLLIPLPATRATLQAITTSPIKITEIDILYKESDGQAIRVVDTIKVENTPPWNDNLIDDVYIYTYESTKPYKTLPQDELVRVYDRVPVRAKAQELISNRITYGNFQNKHTPPASLDYQVGISDKYANTINATSYSTTEYPNHSVKQNRNYQVGVVLADKFGRQSTTILSNNTAAVAGGDIFGADTVYSPYRCDPTTVDCGDTTAPAWPGDSLKVLFNDTGGGAITSNGPGVDDVSLGTPGLYNGDKTSASYNPLGWYSYKIVVKQQEQEYYNVYLPGVMKGEPADPTALKTSNIVLINDNINKVPRDLNEVGPQQKQFRSSVQLFSRVENDSLLLAVDGNKQFYPGRLSDTVSIIQDVRELFDVPGSTVVTSTVEINGFFKAGSNPLIGQVVTTQEFGVTNTASPGPYPTLENLAIYETEPEVSRLDIFWETSTSGLISDLNTAVATDTGGVQSTLAFAFDLKEDDVSGTVVSGGSLFYGADVVGLRINDARILGWDGAEVDPSVGSWVVTNGAGTIITSRFTLIEAGDGSALTPYEYTLQTNDTFYYGPLAATEETYSFSFTYTISAVDYTPPVLSGSLGNISPTIDGVCPRGLVAAIPSLPTVTTLTGLNGSADLTRNTANLTWSIVSQTQGGVPVSIFTMTTISDQGVITAATGAATYIVVARVTDAGGLTADCTLNITLGQPEIPGIFVQTSPPMNDGDGSRYYFSPNYTNLDTAGPISSWVYGASLISPTTSNSSLYCTPPQVGNYTFIRDKQLAGLGIGEGAFYVQFLGESSNTGIAAAIWVNSTVEYRASSASPWTVAIDVDNSLIGVSTTSNYTGEFDGTYGPVGEGGWFGNSYTANEMVLDASSSSTSGMRRVYAFDLPGEYRITNGALEGNGCNWNNCSSTKNINVSQGFIMGDYNYAGGITTPQQYQYNVSGSTYYAKEHITKYVTQLYTDLNLTTTVVFGTTVTKTFYRPGVNWEYTKDGAYTATFNALGQRTTVSAPVLYP
tara:strand:- start:4512 stop:8807 length:4296 start_codon:yes stop_codon:yes gene_type:complete